MRTFWQDQRGQALIETALLFPLLFLILFGFLQLGLSIAEKQKMLYVTHYATQVGSLTNNDLKISGAVEEFYDSDEILLDIESRDNLTGNIIPNTNRQYKDIVTVRLQKPFFLSIPFFEIRIFEGETAASAKILCTNTDLPYTCE